MRNYGFELIRRSAAIGCMPTAANIYDTPLPLYTYTASFAYSVISADCGLVPTASR